VDVDSDSDVESVRSAASNKAKSKPAAKKPAAAAKKPAVKKPATKKPATKRKQDGSAGSDDDFSEVKAKKAAGKKKRVASSDSESDASAEYVPFSKRAAVRATGRAPASYKVDSDSDE